MPNLLTYYIEETQYNNFIVDASLVECPKQRNSREDNQKIKEGEKVEGWNKTKRSQKDVDATFWL